MRMFSKLVIGVAASAPSTRGRLMGGFTLPVAAKWNHRMLPAGEYKFVVSPAISRAWVYVRGDSEAAVFYAASIEWPSARPAACCVSSTTRAAIAFAPSRSGTQGRFSTSTLGVRYWSPAKRRRAPVSFSSL